MQGTESNEQPEAQGGQATPPAQSQEQPRPGAGFADRVSPYAHIPQRTYKPKRPRRHMISPVTGQLPVVGQQMSPAQQAEAMAAAQPQAASYAQDDPRTEEAAHPEVDWLAPAEVTAPQPEPEPAPEPEDHSWPQPEQGYQVQTVGEVAQWPDAEADEGADAGDEPSDEPPSSEAGGPVFNKVRFRDAYSIPEVDRFVSLVTDALAEEECRLTPQDIDRVAFSTSRWRQGYDHLEVDDYVDEVARVVRERTIGRVAGGTPVVRTFTRVNLKEGYTPAEVDAFLERVQQEFENPDSSLSADEMESFGFTTTYRDGYHPGEVDTHIELIAERFRREIEQR